jgi:hypothetical protein
MDRTCSFPQQDFEGMTFEIWRTLDICLYHAAYIKIYASAVAMRLAGSKRSHKVTEGLTQTEREALQEDAMVFRAHFGGVLWQLHHLAEICLTSLPEWLSHCTTVPPTHSLLTFSRPWMRKTRNKPLRLTKGRYKTQFSNGNST